jgi:hypothetical protein
VSGVSGYSEIANEQLDEIEASDDAQLYNDICVFCEFILDHPAEAQSLSSALTTKDGIRFRLAVPGHHPYKVFWSSSGPRIEAVFPYP